MARAGKLKMELMILIVPALLLLVYFQQSIERNRLIKAQLFLQLHEKLSRDDDFRKIERLLDDSESFNFSRFVEAEKESFEEYLRFFDSLIQMQIPNRFSKPEAELLFGRASTLLNRHYQVRKYIFENHKNLDEVLELNSQEIKKLSAE